MTRPTVLMFIGVALLGACTRPDPAAEAAGMFRSGEYARAATAYRALAAADPTASVPRYNLGTSLLLLEDYAAARPHLEFAAAADDPVVAQASHYNAGNSDLLPVFRNEGDEARVEQLERAVAAYKAALRLRPDDFDAKWNLELAQRLLRQEQRSGGGGDSPQQGGGGGGGGGSGDTSRSPAERDPQPQPGAGAGPQPQLSRAEAERVLQAAELRESGLQRAKLKKQQPPSRVAH